MKLKLIIIEFVFILFVLSSCQDFTVPIEQFKKQLNTSDFSKEKKVGELEYNLTYSPPAYLSYLDTRGKSYNSQELDSIQGLYKSTLSFVFTIGSDKSREANFDVMYLGVHDENEYKKRVHLLNFGIQRLVSLKSGKHEMTSAICETESVYGIVKDRKINIVFNRYFKGEDLLNQETLEVQFIDEIFNTGINKFRFNTGDIKEINQLIIKEE